MRRAYQGFTLIELLIVVAIIAILAAIAIPNFLAAQTRAKVSRAKADMKSIATAIESYCVDAAQYPPNDGRYGVTPSGLTTPISYISSRPPDPFAIMAIDERPLGMGYDDEAKYYTYHRIVSLAECDQNGVAPDDPYDAIDYTGANIGAFQKYGKWHQVSLGPDIKYSDGHDSFMVGPQHDGLFSFDILYDPTNGAVSFGNVISTQLNPSGLGVNKLP
jgi:prepilin-type N-terminal cleavage/methylation domain-containing protein